MMDQIDSDISSSSSEDEEDYSIEISKIEEYRTKIKENVEDYDSHVSLIGALRHNEDIAGARAAREQMNLYFPLSPEMWIEWVNDEKEENDNKSIIYNLLRRGTEDYRSVDIWFELCQFIFGYFEDKTEIRKIFEEAISLVGTQFDRGSLIWQTLMIYEKEVVMKSLDDTFAQEQRDRIFKLYSRQLSIPLNENDAVFEEFLDWNKTWKYPEDEIRTQFEKNIKIAELYQPFEKAISEAKAQYASQKVDPNLISKEEAWLNYIAFGIENMNKSDIVNLYERAITDLCLSQPLWSNYLGYLMKNFDRDEDRILTACKRAIRNNTSSLDLRLSLLRNMERFSCSADEIRATLNAVFRAKLTDPSPFIPLWQAYFDFERRQLDLTQSRDLSRIRELFERLVAIENYLDHDPQCSLIKYWAFIEARYGANMEKSRELWAMIRKSLGNNSAALWLENLEFERRFGDFENCKRLMSNAVNSFTDYPEYLFEKVLRWVAEEGNIDSYAQFQKKIEAQQQKVNEKRLKETPQTKPEQSDKKMKRKLSERSSVTPKEKISKLTENVTPDNAKPLKPVIPFEKSAPVQYCDERSVFVSNLNFKVTESELRDVFVKCGALEDIRIIKKVTGQSKGYAYVQFMDQCAVGEALKLEHAPLMERPMYVNRCDANKRHTFNYAVGQTENNKLFVKNLPRTITKEALEEIFGKYGALKEARLVTMRSGVPKGIAYVEYGDEDSASRALVATDGLQVGQNSIEVFLSKTPPKMADDAAPRPSEDAPDRGAVFLKPRALARAPTTQKKLIHKSSVSSSAAEVVEVTGVVGKTNEDFKKFLK